jgi:tetratricopeptide (TPR) repeat protein
MPAKKLTSSVFISHSSKDNEFVDRLAAELKKHRIKFWLDAHELDLGDSLFDTIAPAIDEADYFAVVLSTSSINSLWVKRELNAAMTREDEEDRKIILPLLLEDVRIPRFIKHKVFADFTSDGKFEESFKKILKVLGAREKEVTDLSSGDNLAAKLYPDFFLPDLRFFVGREELLKQIKSTLKTDHRAVIHDISGLGKTFTSYRFVYDNHSDYDKIFWVRATKEEMLESLAKNGEAINPELAKLTEQAAKAKGFKQWLEENDGWLVIYDNVDLPEELSFFVPVNKKGHCVFTSNFSDAAFLGTEISIEKLDKTDSGILLYSRAKGIPHQTPNVTGNEKTPFENLITEIDGLPVTLNSSGAVIFKKKWNFQRFWRKYNETPEIAWDSEDPYSTYQHKSAGKIFSLVYNELCEAENKGKAVKIILDSISFISPNEIPEDLLRAILIQKYEHFAELESLEDFWDDIQEKLTAYDLLKYDGQKANFTTHRSIQRVIQSRLKNKEVAICTDLFAVLTPLFPVYDYDNREVCEKYYQHVLTLVENAGTLRIETENSNNLVYRLGLYQELLGNFSQAEKFYVRAAEISAVFDAHGNSHGIDLNNLGGIYYSQGRYNEAIEKYKEALRIAEKTLGNEHPDRANRLNNLAAVYPAQGRYDEAIEKYEEALQIDGKTIGKEHPDYATRLNNLANVYEGQGRYSEAIVKLEEALRIDEKTIGREHPNYAIDLSSLGNVYSSQGRYDEAIEKLEEALWIREKTIGKEHPSYATTLNNLGNVYSSEGRWEEAVEKYEEALRIDEKTIGKEHPDYATRLGNLANAYTAHGRLEEAKEKLEEALWIDEKSIGKEHPIHATRLNNLGNIFSLQGRLEDAKEKFEEALRIDEKTLGKNHPLYALHLHNLATVLEDQMQYKEALILYEESLRITVKTLPENHPYNIANRENVARCGEKVENN